MYQRHRRKALIPNPATPIGVRFRPMLHQPLSPPQERCLQSLRLNRIPESWEQRYLAGALVGGKYSCKRRPDRVRPEGAKQLRKGNEVS